MKTALIAGATGLVGSHLLKKLLEDERYDKVIILIRKVIPLEHHKLEQIVFNFDKPENDLIKADDVYCCLGTTIGKAGSKKNFEKVDYSYILGIAGSALNNGANQFALVSSSGADKSSRIYYNRVKGKTEEALKQLNYPALLIFRPSMLLGERNEKRPGETFGKVLMNIFSFAIPLKYKAVDADKVAVAMINASNKNFSGIHIFESDLIQKEK